jgi:uncharacterized damage-inducible protein DinB
MDDVGLDRVFLDYSVKKLRQLAARIGDCIGRLSDEQIWMRTGESGNAIGNLVLHLAGNVGQWILAGVGGEPDKRVRASEFAARGAVAAVDLAARLEDVVDRATAALAGVTAARLGERVTIQGYDVTVMECVYHVVEHFSGHTGQIIYATKMLTGGDLGYYSHLTKETAHAEKTP